MASFSEFFLKSIEVFKRGWKLFCLFILILLSPAFLFSIISGIYLSEASLEPSEEVIGGIAIMIFALMAGIIAIITGPAILITFEHCFENKPISLSIAYKKGFPRILNYFVVRLLFSILTILGLLLFIIPGFYFYLSYIFAEFLTVLRKTSIIESFKISKKLTRGHRLSILKNLILLSLILLVIISALIIGIAIISALPFISTGYLPIEIGYLLSFIFRFIASLGSFWFFAFVYCIFRNLEEIKKVD